MSFLRTLAICFSFLTNHRIHSTLDFQSKCPHLFLYEGRCIESDRWYGILVLVPNTVSFRLVFDKPVLDLVLGVFVGYITTRDNQEYLIEIPLTSVKKNTPQVVRFSVRYNPYESAPNLIVFRINEKTLCPDVTLWNRLPIGTQLQTNPLSIDVEADVINEDNTTSYSPNKTHSDDICGTVVAQTKRSYPGQTIYEGEFPWHAALFRRRENEFSYVCGASLISKYHVLTAATCITIRKSRIPVQPRDILVYLGIYHSKRSLNSDVQDRDISEIVIHPQFNSRTYNNNIAVLKFIVPVDITDYVRPVCLWEDSADLSSVAGKEGSVVGWGFNNAGKITEQLMHAKMPVVSRETCIFSYPDFYPQFTFNSTYCAGKLNDTTSICSAVVGDGMVFPKSSSNQKNPTWQLRGLVSIDITSIISENRFKCDPSFYIVFTDVAAHLDWIKKSLL